MCRELCESLSFSNSDSEEIIFNVQERHFEFALAKLKQAPKIQSFFKIHPWGLSTTRADAVSYLVKHMKDHEYDYEILVRDHFDILKTAGYPNYKDSYYCVPQQAWDSAFLKRYKRLIQKVSAPAKGEVIKDLSFEKPPKYSMEEIVSELKKRRWISEASFPGDFTYHQPYIKLDLMLRNFYRKMILKQNYKRVRLPSVIAFNEALKYNYPENTLHNTYLLTACSEDVRDLQIRSFLESKLDFQELKTRTKPFTYFLNYNVCQGFWKSLTRTNIPSFSLFFEDEMVTYRNEHSKSNTLERVEAIRRNEIFYLGSSEEVDNYFDLLNQRFQNMLDLLRIPYRVYSSGAWFDESIRNLGLKTYDYETPLDKKNQRKWLEMGNISNNKDYFTSIFEVLLDPLQYETKSEAKTKPVASQGCSGWGHNRLVGAFLMHNGFEEKDWPKEVLDCVNQTDRADLPGQ